MDDLERLTGALIDAMVDAVVAGLDDAAAAHSAMRGKGEELRARAAAAALLGPKLSKLALLLLGEVERKAMPRYAAYLNSVRYSSDAPINELEDARRSLNSAVLAASGERSPAQALDLALAIVRMRAITTAIGAQCMAEPARGKKKGKGGPELRRREIDASDIPPVVAQAVLAMTQGAGDWDAGLAVLRELETTPANGIGLVSSLLALAHTADGHAHLNLIATRLQRAQFNRGAAAASSFPPAVPLPSEASGPPAIPVPSPLQHGEANPVPPAGNPADGSASAPMPSIQAPSRHVPSAVAGISEQYRRVAPPKVKARERLKQCQAAHSQDSTP